MTVLETFCVCDPDVDSAESLLVLLTVGDGVTLVELVADALTCAAGGGVDPDSAPELFDAELSGVGLDLAE